MAATAVASGAAAKAGMFSNPVGLGLAGAQLALGIGQMIMGDKAAEQEAYNAAYQTTLQNRLVDLRNQERQRIFQAKVDMVRQQITNNIEAAQASYTAEQFRLDDIYGQAAFKQQEMLKRLIETAGAAAATEVYGKSAQRGAMISTLGAYGRTRAQLVKQLISENRQAEQNMSNVERQAISASQQAAASVAVAPAMEMGVSMPVLPGGGGLQSALQIGGLALGAFQTGWDVTPGGGSFLGIKKG